MFYRTLCASVKCQDLNLSWEAIIGVRKKSCNYYVLKAAILTECKGTVEASQLEKLLLCLHKR